MKDPGLLSSGKHPAASALISTVSISAAPLMRPSTELDALSLDLFSLFQTSAPQTSLMVQPPMIKQKQLIPLSLLIPPMTLDQRKPSIPLNKLIRQKTPTSSEVETTDATETTTADELTGETDAASARETAESTVENEITTAIDTDSDDSTQTVASTTDVTDVTTEASTTIGSTDISTEATTDATTETTDATDGNAEDETFDVDTIFTSGTFEIAGGGGDPKDSIFQGEVELAQMKMTKVDGTWSPEFWQASGSLGIDLNGLDISGTVDAAFYRAGSTIPGSALTLPDIGSSNDTIDASTETDGDSSNRTRDRRNNIYYCFN